MTPSKFRKLPVEIEAVRWDATNHSEIENFMEDAPYRFDHDTIRIPTLEGMMVAYYGDYIIKEPFPTDNRKFYPCKPDIFEQTYEPVEEA